MSYSSLPFTSKLFQLTALTISLTLAGCGGGGGGDTVDSIAPTPDTGLVQVTPDGQIPGDSATNASEIYISSNYSGIKMTKGASIEVTALVLDANNGNLAEQPVTFKITDPKATGVFSNSQSKITTDENGKAVIRLEVLNQLSTEQSDYLINNGLIVEASIGNVTKSIKLYGSNDNADIEKQNVYDVFISSDKNQLLTGQDKTTVSIRVTDKKGGIIAGVPVIVSIADAALYGLSLNGTSRQLTDNEGLVEIELIQSRVSVDAQLNHESVLNVVVDDGKNSIVEQNLPIIASGTRVSNVVSSKNAVNAGDNFRVSGQLLDGAAKPVANANFIIYSNDTEAGVGKSDNNGNFAVDLNASSLKPVDDNYLFGLEVKGVEVSQRIPDILTVVSTSSSNIGFSPTTDIIVGDRQKVILSVPDAVDGDSVNVSTNKGKIFASVNDVQGSSRRTLTVTGKKVEFYVESNVPGTATVRAEYGNDSKETVLSFVSIEPKKLILQIERAVLSVGGSTSVMARVLDKDDAPVKNAIVQFTTTRDASGGSLSQAVAYTDDNGRAVTTYNAGQNSTSTDGVVIEAQVQSIRLPDGKEKAVNTLLDNSAITVQTKSTYISFAFADKVSAGSNQVYYFQKGSISVLNSAGKPAINQPVSINLIPDSYLKGEFSIIKDIFGRTVWFQDSVSCGKEDKNNNGILDPNEDFNNNGQLDPVNVAAVINENGQEVTSSQNFNFITDDTGRVDFSIRYPKEYANWYKASVTVNTSVDGSESQQSRVIGFPTLVTDVNIGIPIRPNWTSPFGTDLSCSSSK